MAADAAAAVAAAEDKLRTLSFIKDRLFMHESRLKDSILLHLVGGIEAELGSSHELVRIEGRVDPGASSAAAAAAAAATAAASGDVEASKEARKLSSSEARQLKARAAYVRGKAYNTSYRAKPWLGSEDPLATAVGCEEGRRFLPFPYTPR